MSFQRKEDWLVHFQISSQSFSLPLVIPSLSKSFYIACLSPRLTEQGWSKFLRISRDAPEIYPVLLASCAGLTFAVCIMGHNLFGNADVNLTRRDPYNVPPSEMDSIEERDAYAERMLRFRRNPLRRLVEGRAPAIFTSTNEKMSGLGYKQYTHGKHEKPVLLANSEHEMQED